MHYRCWVFCLAPSAKTCIIIFTLLWITKCSWINLTRNTYNLECAKVIMWFYQQNSLHLITIQLSSNQFCTQYLILKVKNVNIYILISNSFRRFLTKNKYENILRVVLISSIILWSDYTFKAMFTLTISYKIYK